MRLVSARVAVVGLSAPIAITLSEADSMARVLKSGRMAEERFLTIFPLGQGSHLNRHQQFAKITSITKRLLDCLGF